MQHQCDRGSETTLGRQAFERGVWYYSGLELIDHHDMSGFENIYAVMETLCGRETRPQFFINLLNRLRTLDFSNEIGQPRLVGSVEALIEPCCTKSY